MVRLIFLILTVFLVYPAVVQGEGAVVRGEVVKPENPISKMLIDKVAPPVIKGMVKLYLHGANLNKAKTIGKNKIIGMDDAKYEKRLTKVCHDLKSAGLDNYYGIYQGLKKEEAVHLIDGLSKKGLMVMINEIPNEAISKVLRDHFSRHPDSAPKDKKRLIDELRLLKDKLSKKLYGRYRKNTSIAR